MVERRMLSGILSFLRQLIVPMSVARHLDSIAPVIVGLARNTHARELTLGHPRPEE